MRSPIVLLILMGLTIMSGLSALAHEQTPLALSPPAHDAPIVVRTRVATPDDLLALVHTGLDLIGREDDEISIVVSGMEYDRLVADGWDVWVDEEQTRLLHQISTSAFSDGYRTVEEIEAFLVTMAERYPQVATLIDAGSSWQQSSGYAGHQLWALRMTNPEIPGKKPVFFLLATIHAREIVTSEIATRFIEYLLVNNGVDAEVTWLLNEHEIVVLPMANPDGHKLAEQGYLHRKNTNTSFGGDCPWPSNIAYHYGVDLNRNFSFQWGVIDRPTIDPCAATFPGNRPASEPETRAIEALIRSLYPNRPRPATGVAAPAETDGVLISLHSYGELVLWPWGHTYEDAPNGAGLAQLGRRLASFNGYRPGPSISLYPVSGNTDDWSYAELGIASYTFEIGPVYGECGGFFPPSRCLESGQGGNFWARNLPALLYAARVSRAPYTQPGGPQVSSVEITPTLVLSDTTYESLDVQVQFDARHPRAVAAEAYLGVSSWYGGAALPMQSDVQTTTWHLALMHDARYRNTTTERTLLLVRGKTDAGVWGPFHAGWVDTSLVPVTTYRLWLPLLQCP